MTDSNHNATIDQIKDKAAATVAEQSIENSATPAHARRGTLH